MSKRIHLQFLVCYRYYFVLFLSPVFYSQVYFSLFY